MKKEQLKQIIKEELQAMLNEMEARSITPEKRAAKCAAAKRLYDKAQRGELGEEFQHEYEAQALQTGKHYECVWAQGLNQNQP